ncbi:C45 family peptidase [Labilibaculum euxinus]
MKLFIKIILVFIVLNPIISEACTTAVVSGKYTKSGRPMIWKNRDTWAVKNSVAYFKGDKFDYMGLINSADTARRNVWIGMNSAGFAIMNSASYNLNHESKEELSGLEGRLMKTALSVCGTLEDFENLLNSMQKPSGLEANFGVIDAFGGAAYYEFGHNGFVKIDVNDPAIAPFGYVIRANYSNTGEIGIGSGYIRYNTSSDLFYQSASSEGLSAQFIEQDVAESLKHSLIKEDLKLKYGNLPENTSQYAHFRDFIPRSGSASSVIIEGVKKDENPEFATMWSNIGFPLASVVVPVWLKGGSTIPEIVSYNTALKDSPICNATLVLKKEKIMNIRWGKSDKYYINVNALYNSDKSGIVQKLRPYDNHIYELTNELIDKWRQKGRVDKREISEFYKWLDRFVAKAYKDEFNIEM